MERFQFSQWIVKIQQIGEIFRSELIQSLKREKKILKSILYMEPSARRNESE